MNSPLSIFTYYLNNKRKVIPLIGIIALSVLGITATAAFTGAINKDVLKQLAFYQHFSVVEIEAKRGSQIDSAHGTIKEVKKELASIEEIEYFFPGQMQPTHVPALLGTSFAQILFVQADDADAVLQTLGWEITDGRLPKKGEPEVLLGESLQLRKEVSLDEAIGNQAEGEADDVLPGSYKVVGTAEGQQLELFSLGSVDNSLLGFGSYDWLVDNTTRLKYSFFIKAKEGEEESVHQQIMELVERREKDRVTARTSISVREDIQQEFGGLNLLLWALNAVTIIVISFSAALLNIIFFMQRANEFGLLAAIGYDKRYIIGKTILESAGMVIIGWVLGVAMAEGGYMLLNDLVFTVPGVENLTIFEWRTIIFSLPVPIAVIIFSALTVAWKLWRLDPISVIEQRD